jgi:hypothetical protein
LTCPFLNPEEWRPHPAAQAPQAFHREPETHGEYEWFTLKHSESPKRRGQSPDIEFTFLTMFLRCDAIVKLPLKSEKNEASVTFFAANDAKKRMIYPIQKKHNHELYYFFA